MRTVVLPAKIMAFPIPELDRHLEGLRTARLPFRIPRSLEQKEEGLNIQQALNVSRPKANIKVVLSQTEVVMSWQPCQALRGAVRPGIGGVFPFQQVATEISNR